MICLLRVTFESILQRVTNRELWNNDYTTPGEGRDFLGRREHRRVCLLHGQ